MSFFPFRLQKNYLRLSRKNLCNADVPHILDFHSRGKAEIKMETFKSESLESGNERRWITKSLAENQVYAMVHMRDIRKNVLPKFIELCMEMQCLCPFQGHKYGCRKPTETSVFEFSYL